MANQWFKLYGGEYLNDPKIASLTPQERSCWITLLCLASTSSTPGTIEFLTVGALLQKSGILWDPYNPDEWNAAMKVLDRLKQMKMIELGESGVITIKNWDKRQETNLTNAERQARFREKNKNSNASRYESNARIEENRINNTAANAAPILEVRESEEGVEVKKTGYTKAALEAYKKMVAWAEAERGFPFLKGDILKQYKAFKIAKDNGLKSGQLQERWLEMAEDKFWGEKGFDWMNVVASFNKKRS